MSSPVCHLRSARGGSSVGVAALAVPGACLALSVSFASGSAAAPEDVHFWPARIDLTGETSDRGRVVDLDGDGRGEYIGGHRVVRVFRPTSTGWLTSDSSFELVGSEPPFHVVDHDGDGLLDVIAMSAEQPGVGIGIWHGRGDGTFDDPELVTLEPHGTFAVPDLDGDGRLDLALTITLGPRDRGVAVYRGTPDGGFVRLGEYPSTTAFSQRALSGDLDGDGRDELVTWSDHVRAWSLALDGTMTTTVIDPPSAYAVILADLDGDAILDLVRTSQSSRLARIDRGRGDATFEPLTSITGHVTLGIPHVADLDLDGDLDLVLPLGEGMATSDWFTIALNRGDGTFDLDDVRHFTPQVPRGIATGDVDGDGVPDVVAGTLEGIVTYRGDGRGGVHTGTQLRRFVDEQGVVGASIVDVIPGGHPEVVRFGSEIVVHAITDGRELSAGIRTELGQHHAAAFGDLDGDGVIDVVTVPTGYEMPSGIVVRLGDGLGGFEPREAIESAHPLPDLTLADLTGDGHLDLLAGPWEGRSRGIRLWPGTGDGRLAPLSWTDDEMPTTGRLGVADVTGDGRKEILVPSGPLVLVLAVTPSGEVELRTSLAPPDENPPYQHAARSTAAADLTGDGILDVVVGTEYSVATFAGRGTGGFEEPASYPGVRHVTDLACADVDRDGDLDVLAMAHTSTHVFLNQGDGTLEREPLAYGTGPDAGGIDVGDLDGDGVPDLLSTIWDHAQVMWGVGPSTPPIGPGTPDRPWTVSLAPSPASGATRIGLDLGRIARVGVSVHDVSGRRMVELAPTRALDPGPHAWIWDGTTLAGRSVAAGVYVVRVEVDGVEELRRLVLLD